MRILLGILVLCFLANVAKAQDERVKALKAIATRTIKKDDKDTSHQVWKKGAAFALNVNQGSLTNWSAGGDKFSLSINGYTNLFAFYQKDKQSWDNSLEMAYGIINTTSLGHRKASDRLEYTSKYGYYLSKKVDIGGLVNLRSQFANGFAYGKDSQGGDSNTLVSKPLQPAYLLLSPGFNYKPVKPLSIFVSPVTARWIFVMDDFLKPMYNVPLNKMSKQEFGAFASINYLQVFSKKLTVKSKLDLFSNYQHDPKNIDVFWNNVVTAKITRYINFSLNVDLIYDNDTKNVDPAKGPAPQILQLMGIGFAYSLKSHPKKPPAPPAAVAPAAAEGT